MVFQINGNNSYRRFKNLWPDVMRKRVSECMCVVFFCYSFCWVLLSFRRLSTRVGLGAIKCVWSLKCVSKRFEISCAELWNKLLWICTIFKWIQFKCLFLFLCDLLFIYLFSFYSFPGRMRVPFECFDVKYVESKKR